MVKEMNNNKGIAIAGIGICSFNTGLWTIAVAFIAAMATEIVMKN